MNEIFSMGGIGLRHSENLNYCFSQFVYTNMTVDAMIEWDPETTLYIGIVPGIQGAHTQAATLDELDKNLIEVIELCYEENREELL